jgi:putative membrane protein
MSMSAQDQERIAAAIRAAEAKTSGEIVCVLAQVSTDTTALPVFIAAVAALALPWLLVALTTLPVHPILLYQIALFIVLLIVLCLPVIRVALVPKRARRAMAHRVAMEQFVSRGIARKKDRSGILIFVSLAEHYVRIIADDGIAAKVPQSDWQDAVNALVAHLRDEHIGDGFVSAIELCGARLAQHFPRTATSGDELPDRIYLI